MDQHHDLSSEIKPLRLEQKRHSNRTTFEFGEEELTYSIADRSGARSLASSYADISRDRNILVERNEWLGNVGLLWLVLGAVFTGLAFTAGEFRISIWVWVGAACYLFYRVRVTEYTVIPTQKGSVLVIKTDGSARILTEIERRRAIQLREWYDFVDAGEDPDQSRKRYRFLHREGALSEEELAERISRLEQSVLATAPQVEAQRLN